MLIVREVFIAKPGHAGELAKMMKQSMAGTDMAKANPKVLLDCVTDYNTIVIEYEVESLTAFDKMMEQEKAKGYGQKKESTGPKYTDLYLTGRREIFRIVE
jgi:hypothetical protein